jgi:hypothetical protein
MAQHDLSVDHRLLWIKSWDEEETGYAVQNN